MKRKRFTEERIIAVLREHEAGAKAGDLARKQGVSEATLYIWRAKYGGMVVSDAKRLKALEDENAKLKRLLAEKMLEVSALRELLSKKMAGPAAKREAVAHLQTVMGLSERRACSFVGAKIARRSAIRPDARQRRSCGPGCATSPMSADASHLGCRDVEGVLAESGKFRVRGSQHDRAIAQFLRIHLHSHPSGRWRAVHFGIHALELAAAYNSEQGKTMQRHTFTTTDMRRRQLLLGAGGAAATAGLGLVPGRLFAQEPISIAGIYTVPVEQQWVGRIHAAAEAAQAAGQITYTFTENTANTDYTRVMREYAEQGVKLIIGEIFGVEQEAREVVLDYPDTAFLLGSSFLEDPAYPNLGVFDNYIQDASYLSGIIAGSMTKTGNIGMVGGFPIPEVNRLMHAFMAGIRETSPDASFQVSFIGSWFDPPKAKETAFAMIENGADMLYAERFGVSDAAQERDILAIGNVIDTQPDYPETVVTSALWHFEPTLQAALARVADGSFVAANYGVYSFMKEDGCSLAPLGTFEGKVPQAAIVLVMEREAAIRAGDYVVEINDEEPSSS